MKSWSIVLILIISVPAMANSHLDLREANVTNVQIDFEGEQIYYFSVTLIHDDDGEEGYADLWIVQQLNGTELGRRELLHTHGNEAFTRSTDVFMPEDISFVVVRGHDQTHGWGGQAVIVEISTNNQYPIKQGPEQNDFTNWSLSSYEKSNSNGSSTSPVYYIYISFFFSIFTLVLINRMKQR